MGLFSTVQNSQSTALSDVTEDSSMLACWFTLLSTSNPKRQQHFLEYFVTIFALFFCNIKMWGFFKVQKCCKHSLSQQLSQISPRILFLHQAQPLERKNIFFDASGLFANLKLCQHKKKKH